MFLLYRLRSTERKRLLAGVALSSAAIEVDGRLPSAAGSSAAFGGVSDGAAAGGALLGCIWVENAAGTGLNLSAVEDRVRKVLGIRGEVTRGRKSVRYAPSAISVGITSDFVLFLASRGDQAVVKRVGEGEGNKSQKAGGAERQHNE